MTLIMSKKFLNHFCSILKKKSPSYDLAQSGQFKVYGAAVKSGADKLLKKLIFQNFRKFFKKRQKSAKNAKIGLFGTFLTIEKNSFLAHISKVIFLCHNFIHRRKLIRNYVFRTVYTLSYEAVFTKNFQKTRFFAYFCQQAILAKIMVRAGGRQGDL